MKQIRYSLENPIVIKHSSTVAKFPTYCQNPVITYHFNVTSNWKEVYTFAVSRYAPEGLTLDIKSINFNVNILTIFSEGCKALINNVFLGNISDFQLLFLISDSIIRSSCH